MPFSFFSMDEDIWTMVTAGTARKLLNHLVIGKYALIMRNPNSHRKPSRLGEKAKISSIYLYQQRRLYNRLDVHSSFTMAFKIKYRLHFQWCIFIKLKSRTLEPLSATPLQKETCVQGPRFMMRKYFNQTSKHNRAMILHKP